MSGRQPSRLSSRVVITTAADSQRPGLKERSKTSREVSIKDGDKFTYAAEFIAKLGTSPEVLQLQKSIRGSELELGVLASFVQRIIKLAYNCTSSSTRTLLAYAGLHILSRGGSNLPNTVTSFQIDHEN